jgi:RimJ/RimL family protein N-acetyltransferase
MFPEIARDDIFRLETPRLWLRWPRAADQGSICRLAGDPEVALKTARIPHPYEPYHAEAYILAVRSENASGAGLTLALTPKRQSDEAVGMIGVHGASSRGAGAIGFWLGRPFWGRGLMSEAASAFIDVVFGMTGLERIVSSALPSNAASLRVHEKLGFTRSGRGKIPAPARGGEIEVEFFDLRRGARPTSFGARRMKLQST